MKSEKLNTLLAVIPLAVIMLGGLSLPLHLLGQSSGLVQAGAEVIKVRGDFGFIEGPVADASGNLFFTDIDNNRVHRLSVSGELTVVYEPSNNANGLTMDLNGNLLICEQSAQRVTSRDAQGNITVIADTYNGRKFNGVIGTEDGRTLYVADTQLRKVFQFDIAEDGSLSNRREFADQGSDGMTMDERGNVYLTWGPGVGIFNPDGERIEFIDTPENPANVGFAGADGRTLYLTARTGLYSVRMNVRASR